MKLKLIIEAASILTLVGCGNQFPAKDGLDSNPTDTTDNFGANQFSVGGGYPLATPNFFYSFDTDERISIQADVATNVWDPDFQCIVRIEILKKNRIMPDVSGKTFTIEDGPQKFPGWIFIAGGHSSFYKQVQKGTITFYEGSLVPEKSSKVIRVEGEFEVTMLDLDAKIVPIEEYPLTGNFKFTVGTYGPADPMPSEVYPQTGKETYDVFCASCHSLGAYDPKTSGEKDLLMQGGGLPKVYPGTRPEHLAIPPFDLLPLRTFINYKPKR